MVRNFWVRKMFYFGGSFIHMSGDHFTLAIGCIELYGDYSKHYKTPYYPISTTHRIHVWYIHLHFVDFYEINVGKYTSPMDPMGNGMSFQGFERCRCFHLFRILPFDTPRFQQNSFFTTSQENQSGPHWRKKSSIFFSIKRGVSEQTNHLRKIMVWPNALSCQV